MLMAMGLFLLACGSDDRGSDADDVANASSDVIVGNWIHIGDVDEDGYEGDEHGPCDDEFLKFGADAAFRTTINYCGEEAEAYTLFWQKVPARHKYVFSDGSGSSEEVKVVFTQNNDIMTIYEYEDESGFYGIVYRRH